MADSDYDRGDRRDDDRRDDDRRDDDRPRRRRDDDAPPKKKSPVLLILLIIGGILLVCAGVCGVGGYFYIKAVADVIQTPEQFLTKVRGGDYAGAYGMTTTGYQSRYSLEQVTAAMKKAQLDQNTGPTGPATTSQTGQTTMTLTTPVGVPGKTTTVTFSLKQEGGATTFKIDDITGPDIAAPTTGK